jgi:SAM-dependent methyltransferase
MNTYYKTRYEYDERRNKVWKAITELLQKYIDPQHDSVLDLGSGYCNFINNIQAKKKYAVDIQASSGGYVSDDVVFYSSTSSDLHMFPDKLIDVVFSSNLFEHLSDDGLHKTFQEISRITSDNAKLIIIQPNYRYCYKEYFDDYTHKKVFSHVSLVDFVKLYHFEPLKLYPRFLPLTFKSKFPNSYLLTKLYLYSPFKFLAKQMLLVSEKKG